MALSSLELLRGLKLEDAISAASKEMIYGHTLLDLLSEPWVPRRAFPISDDMRQMCDDLDVVLCRYDEKHFYVDTGARAEPEEFYQQVMLGHRLMIVEQTCEWDA